MARPVLLIRPCRVVVKPDEQKIVTTNLATGLNFSEFTPIDSADPQFSVPQVTQFGRTSGLLNLSTSCFEVHLHPKLARQPSLAQLKSNVKQTAIHPEADKDPEAAARKLDEAASLPQPIDSSSTSWRW